MVLVIQRDVFREATLEMVLDCVVVGVEADPAVAGEHSMRVGLSQVLPIPFGAVSCAIFAEMASDIDFLESLGYWKGVPSPTIKCTAGPDTSSVLPAAAKFALVQIWRRATELHWYPVLRRNPPRGGRSG